MKRQSSIRRSGLSLKKVNGFVDLLKGGQGQSALMPFFLTTTLSGSSGCFFLVNYFLLINTSR